MKFFLKWLAYIWVGYELIALCIPLYIFLFKKFTNSILINTFIGDFIPILIIFVPLGITLFPQCAFQGHPFYKFLQGKKTPHLKITLIRKTVMLLWFIYKEMIVTAVSGYMGYLFYFMMDLQSDNGFTRNIFVIITAFVSFILTWRLQGRKMLKLKIPRNEIRWEPDDVPEKCMHENMEITLKTIQALIQKNKNTSLAFHIKVIMKIMPVHGLIFYFFILYLLAGCAYFASHNHRDMLFFWLKWNCCALFFYWTTCLVYYVFIEKKLNHKSMENIKTHGQWYSEKFLLGAALIKVGAGIKSGALQKSEQFHKIKFPVVGFKDKKVKVFEWYEDTSWLLNDGIAGWNFYDAQARLVLPKIVPPLTGWKRKLRQNFLGKYLNDVPIEGWVWFHLKHPVKIQK